MVLRVDILAAKKAADVSLVGLEAGQEASTEVLDSALEDCISIFLIHSALREDLALWRG
jgi:hypothetical protein